MRSPGSIPLMPIVVIAVVFVAGLGSYGAYMAFVYKPHQPAEAEALYAATNDTVSVDYIGMFEDGTVFDTSIASVAYNDQLYPKSQMFSVRPNGYSPLNFTIGSGQTVAGFNDGVIGMYVGETRYITVPPEKGYGNADKNLIKTYNLVETAPVLQEHVSISSFTANYSLNPSLGLVVKDKYWGWNVSVFFIDQQSQMVTLRAEPTIGMIVRPHDGWDSKVISIDQSADGGVGRITVRNLITVDDENKITGAGMFGQTYRLIDVDENAGTYTLDYNQEVVGRTLIFRVTLLSITKPPK